MPRSIDPENRPDVVCANPAAKSVTEVQADVLAAVSAATSRMTPLDLQRQVATRHRHDRRQIQAAIYRLVTEGELNYINASGRTTIELSFNRPVQISKRITLSPAGRSSFDDGNRAVVVLQAGAAFGDGRHPSTRLALVGIEVVLDDLLSDRDVVGSSVLNIGTGSGVLVVAAVRLGIAKGIGVDIDPCALAEAGANVKLNGLTGRIAISDQSIDTIKKKFTLVCANLRLPTLKSMRDQIKSCIDPAGALVLSGIKATEVKMLIDWYASGNFTCRWHSSQDGWAALVMQLAI